MNCYAVVDIEPKIIDYTAYPEKKLTLNELVNYSKSFYGDVTTQSPFIVSSYKTENVYIFANGKWINPDFNTFGASIELIYEKIFGVISSIPNEPKRKMSEICKLEVKTKEDIEKIKRKLDIFGESIEKDICLSSLNRKAKELA